jgi:hypothetical protein
MSKPCLILTLAVTGIATALYGYMWNHNLNSRVSGCEALNNLSVSTELYSRS